MVEDLKAWSDDRDEIGHESQWERMGGSISQEIRLFVHVHYLKKYLKGNERVLEIGAGRGRFTGELAHLCSELTVADISSEKLELNKRNALALGYVDKVKEWVQSDVLDLSAFADESFDAVVCYGGPISYVTDRRDKALKELRRVTRRGGLLFISVMSLWGRLHAHFPEILQDDPRLLREIIATGDIGPDAVAVASNFYHAFRPEELEKFINTHGLVTKEMAASDCLTSTWVNMLKAWRGEPKAWDILLEMELQAASQPGCVGMGSRIIAVAARPE